VERGFLLALAVVGTLAAVTISHPSAFAQTDVPASPTEVAVYTYKSEQLEVRWSTSDAASTTSFKVQWKSGSEEFDSSRQVTSDPATSIESDQSTSAGERYAEIVTGLTDGTEYTVRVIATNANGDSEPSGEVTGTPQSLPGQVKAFVETEVVELFEDSYPWLRETWDYITAENIPVEFFAGWGGNIYRSCDRVEMNLKKCRAENRWGGVRLGRYYPRPVHLIAHELAHVYTLANGVAAEPGPLGIAFLYFYDLLPPTSYLLTPPELLKTLCPPSELYADALALRVHGDRDILSYWKGCDVVTDDVAVEALAVVTSAAAGEMPSWLAETFEGAKGDLDLDHVWARVGAITNPEDQAAVVYQLRNTFGGYCDNKKATESASGNGVTRNPWSNGGCTPEAPTNVSVTAVGNGTLAVSWQEPPYDGGSPIEGYKIRWKSGSQQYSASRQVVVTDLTNLWTTTRGLVSGVTHTVGVLAYNHNGEGAVAEMTATPTATDTTAPVLLTARLDREHAQAHLAWNEALDASSLPAASAFTVNVNGVARSHGVSVLENVVTLESLGTLGPADVVTVSYTAPTGPTATPLKDSAGNHAPNLSAQAVRNDKTEVAFTSDPGADQTYAWHNGAGTQDVIEATVTFSESVLVTGVPKLKLDIGGQTPRATYRSGSGTNSLVFRYAVVEGEADADGITVVHGAIEGLIHYASTRDVAPGWVGYESSPAYELTPHFVDAVRPTLLSANILAGETELAMKWDKPLDEDSVPAPGGRSSTGNPGPKVWDSTTRMFLEISAVSVEGNVMTLTLASPVTGAADLTASYGTPGLNPLKDTVGNQAAHNVVEAPVTTDPNSPPEFPTTEDGARTIDENTPADSNVGAPVAAPDADGDGLTYSISGADAVFFDVIATSGQLRTKAVLDYEDRVTYSFTMTVTDRKDVYGRVDPAIDDTINVTVTVANVDEGADISLAAAGGVTANDNALTVDENHTGALATFSASDPENKAGLTYTWSLGGVDAADFAIAPAGVLSFANVPNYESPADSGRDNVYEITVIAHDSDGQTGGLATFIEVADVNEPPTFPSPTMTRLVYQGAEVGDNVSTPVAARDVEQNDTLLYSLFGTDAGFFDIDPDSGQITVGDGVTFDIEHRDTYAVVVEADDRQGGRVTVEVTITVTSRPVGPVIFIGGGGGGGPTGPTPSELDFEWTVKHDIEELDAGHDMPSGMWSDGTTLWLLENGDGADDAVYAYDLASGERVESREFALAETNRAPRGIWSNGTTAWVSDSGRERLFAYDLETGERDEEREIVLAPRNRDARGIWSDGATMWVLDGIKDSLFAYDLETGEPLAEYALDSRNGDPRGIWSDGVTIWISDHGLKDLWAYRLPARPGTPAAEGADRIPLERVRDEDFTNLSSSSNNSPRGIWSDGDVMYVADESDDKIYTYNIPDAIDARLATLTLSGVEIGEFDPATLDYEGTVGEGVTQTTVEAAAVQRRTNVAIEPPDAHAKAEGHQVALNGVDAITITVTSADGKRARVYRVAFEPAVIELALTPTWTSFEWPGADGTPVAVALREGGVSGEVLVIYEWDEAARTWQGHFPGLEGVPGLNTLATLTQGETYWIVVEEPVTWSIPLAGSP